MWPGDVAIPAFLVPCGQAVLPSQPPWCHMVMPCCHPSLPVAMWPGHVAIQATPGAMWLGTVAIQASLVPGGQITLPSQPPWCYVARPCCHPNLQGAIMPDPFPISASLVACGQALLPSQLPLCHVAGHCSHTSSPVAIQASLLPCGQALLPS